MGSTQFGKFHNFCRDSTLPVCNLFLESYNRGGNGFGGCELTGISLSKGRHLRNLGSILLCGIAIVVSAFLLWRSERKKAAVGRREIQMFIAGYMLVELCEIFTVGGFPLGTKTRMGFTALHLAAIAATTWILLLNGAVGFQIIDDGTLPSLGLIALSAAAIFIGTGYIALDTGFSWTGHFDPSLNDPNRNIGLYVLYLLAPLVFIFLFFVLETVLVLRVLGERRPVGYLLGAALLFAIGQIFQFVISTHLCNKTSGGIDGALFETLFTLLAVVMIWVFWSSITEEDWPAGPGGGEYMRTGPTAYT
ncbi:MAG: hypothetical protein M1824_003209 [Vezdaea acicularis]|nr:MAG: hypothetical protein M1824_003209 [Vezdaea acicularis]